MASRKKYESKAKTTMIRFTSRASVCIEGNYYTLEACEERCIPDIEGVDLNQERQLLWDTVNAECDKQIEDTYQEYLDLKEKRRSRKK